MATELRQRDIKKIIGKETEFGMYQFLCPTCGDEYVHVESVATLQGKDNYEAWEGRGDCHIINMNCENGHRWALRFGEHKGNISIYITKEPIKK